MDLLRGEETSSPGSIAYAALHARTEAFLKASRNYQVAVKGPLMDATDVYLQQKAWALKKWRWAVVCVVSWISPENRLQQNPLIYIYIYMYLFTVYEFIIISHLKWNFGSSIPGPHVIWCKERYEHFAHNLDKGGRQQHKLIHMMRSSLRKHHG